MAQASNFLETELLACLLQSTNPAPTVFGGLQTPPNIYVALTTVAVTDTDTGSTITEAAYSEYQRVQAGTGRWQLRGGTAGSFENMDLLGFPLAGSGANDTVIGFALVDALTAGRVLVYGTCSLSITQGITPQFQVSSIVINLD